MKTLTIPELTLITEKITEEGSMEILHDRIGNCYLKHKDSDNVIEPGYYGANMRSVKGLTYHGNPNILFCCFINDDGEKIFGIYLIHKRKWLGPLFSEVLSASRDLNHIAGRLLQTDKWAVYNIDTEKKIMVKFSIEKDEFDSVELHGGFMEVRLQNKFSEQISL